MLVPELLAELRKWRSRFGPGQVGRITALLLRLERARIADANALIAFHETVLFLRAYPPSQAVFDAAGRILAGFSKRVRELDEAGGDFALFEEPEVSGIAGTRMTAIFGYATARELAARHREAVEVDWERYSEPERLHALASHMVPLLEDDAAVEAVVPWREWIVAAAGDAQGVLAWLLEQVDAIAPGTRSRADLYDSLRLPLCWDLGNTQASRTHMQLPAPNPFFHTTPLIARREISLDEIVKAPPLRFQRLTRQEGARKLALARDTSAARFRELYGFSHGAPSPVYRVEAGRGVEFILSGVPPEHRLPLRAYHAATIWKNGVPIGYFEALTLFERMEAGFNVYYTFREGETAWLYQQLLRMFHQYLGVTVIAIDPYQVGHDNEEAIASGAFWFYRKLGFRPMQPEAVQLMRREENRIRSRTDYRSSQSTLRRLADSSMIYEFPGTVQGDWDRFQTRQAGIAAAKVMGSEFGGNIIRMRRRTIHRVVRATGWKIAGWTDAEREVLAQWAPLLGMIPDLGKWLPGEKRHLEAILRAKAGAEEAVSVRLMQTHARLRRAVLSLGNPAA